MLNPSKRVTFQFQIPKLNGEKRTVVTMVKINKLDSNKRSGISPFLYTPEVFPDETATQNIETTENGSKLKSKIVRVEYIIREAIHRLKIQIFGNERFGLQSFIQLKRTMTAMKIGNECKIQTWSKRFNTFQDFLPRYLWIAGAKQGL